MVGEMYGDRGDPGEMQRLSSTCASSEYQMSGSVLDHIQWAPKVKVLICYCEREGTFLQRRLHIHKQTNTHMRDEGASTRTRSPTIK